MEVKNIGHQDSVTMGTYDIEEIEKSNRNKVDIIWKQSQQIEKLKDKLQKQAEWIENNKNKAKNCAMQMQNQGKEIQRLKQSNKDLMAVIWKTKRERANKGREVCKANNEVVQYKKRIAELEEQLKKFESIEKEIGCDTEVFWKVYRKISGHGNIGDLSLYTITDENEIIKIMPTEIISGTYSNYPQDCSFKYWIWDNVKGCYKHTYTYFHFHDYKRYWFLTKEEAQAKLEELKGEKR